MTTKDIVYVALFAALIAALSVFPPLMIPLIGVPITAQSMGVMLAGGILGAKRGALAVILFLILIMVGMPFLSGGRGGLAVFASPTGGFLIGWVVSAFVIGWLIERRLSRLKTSYVFSSCVLGGIGCLYLLGVPWSAFIASVSLSKAFFGSLVFIIGDLIKAGLATMTILFVSHFYPLIEVRDRQNG